VELGAERGRGGQGAFRAADAAPLRPAGLCGAREEALEVGEEVAMLFGAAERDHRRFPDPDRFDIGRGDTAHIGFGGGIHFCVGAPLARQEIEVSVAGLAKRFPNLSMVEAPQYQPNFVIRGLQSLHLSA
jgi:cytochrome P450